MGLPCTYCDIYLTHDSMNARKAHNAGRNHVANVRDYFSNLGKDGAQNMIDQIVSTHEGGGRAMFAAPSMRLGAGFMNPMATAPQGGSPYPPFQGGNAPTPPFPPRPPFPPSQAPPFPPPGGAGAPPFPPPGGARPPFPPPGQNQRGAGGPPPQFTPQQGPPPAGNPGVHPDRMRMMGQ